MTTCQSYIHSFFYKISFEHPATFSFLHTTTTDSNNGFLALVERPSSRRTRSGSTALVVIPRTWSKRKGSTSSTPSRFDPHASAWRLCIERSTVHAHNNHTPTWSECSSNGTSRAASTVCASFPSIVCSSSSASRGASADHFVNGHPTSIVTIIRCCSRYVLHFSIRPKNCTQELYPSQKNPLTLSQSNRYSHQKATSPPDQSQSIRSWPSLQNRNRATERRSQLNAQPQLKQRQHSAMPSQNMASTLQVLKQLSSLWKHSSRSTSNSRPIREAMLVKAPAQCSCPHSCKSMPQLYTQTRSRVLAVILQRFSSLSTAMTMTASAVEHGS